MNENKWTKLITVIVCMVMLLSLMAGCSNQKANNMNVTQNKTLTFATAAELTTLYPLNMDPQNNCVTKLVYEGLVTYDEGEIKPLLAETWEFNEDGTQLTLHLKQGVKFHDGTDFNAEAVKKNLDYYHLSPNHRILRVVANMNEAVVIDEYTLTLNYDAPYFAYLNDLCYPEVLVMVSPDVIEEGNYQTMKAVVGTGPYTYAENKAGEYARFEKNENYWGELPYYDEVMVKYIHESASRLQALQNGEIDMLYGNVLMSYDEYQQAASINNIKGEISDVNSETRNLAVNIGSQMLSDIKVREAIEYAIDKQRISDGLTYGYEEVADTLFDSDIPYTDVEMNITRTFDKSKAEALLDEAGWKQNSTTGYREKDGVTLKLLFTYDSGEVLNKTIATVIKSQLAEVGIDMETVGQDMYTWWQEGVAGNYDLTIWCTEQPYTVPHNFFTPMLGSSCHVPAIAALDDGDEFVAAISEFSITDDKNRIADIFDYLINYSNDNVLNIPLTYIKDMIVYNTDKISDYEFTSTPMFFDIRHITSK
nr:nickel ABC transporter substrate-binding protein [Sedimentibacter sp.]